MYQRTIESVRVVKLARDAGMKEDAAYRLRSNAKNRKLANTCAPGTPNRKMEAARQRRISDYEQMLKNARPTEDHSGYHKPGAFKK